VLTLRGRMRCLALGRPVLGLLLASVACLVRSEAAVAGGADHKNQAAVHAGSTALHALVRGGARAARGAGRGAVHSADGSLEVHAGSMKSGLVRSSAYKHRLRVCNAYPYGTPLDIYLLDYKLTEFPMAYKVCREFEPTIKSGDTLEFKFGEDVAGTFVVSDLPARDAVLVLVIYRHDAVSMAAAFESHVFTHLLNVQIAVIDTYRGPAKATLRIQDVDDAATSRSEELRYDTVVAVNEGHYEVVLVGSDSETKARKDFIARNTESYVVIRVGVQPHNGKSYPQELVVYPETKPEALEMERSGTERIAGQVGLLGMSLLVLLTMA